MANYYLDSKAQPNGSHQVHLLNCQYLPSTEYRILLGRFNSCDEALAMAKKKYHPSKMNGCFYCVTACHNS